MLKYFVMLKLYILLDKNIILFGIFHSCVSLIFFPLLQQKQGFPTLDHKSKSQWISVGGKGETDFLMGTLRRLRSVESKIWKANNQLFCYLKALTSLRLNIFQQSKVCWTPQELF